MPNVNGIEGLKLIRQHFPSIRILMQTVFDDDEKIFDEICAGADRYILKGMSYQKIAGTCNISATTVNSNIQHIYEKRHVHSATEAVSKAIQRKIV